MNETIYDVIIIGSGAGGAAAAFSLVGAGKRVLLLEKGEYLPRDGSTLDVKKVFKGGKFKNQRAWVDHQNQSFIPGEFYNVGGKTKWYGATLLRFSPHEFESDEAFKCLSWPIDYKELEPYYDQAEELLHVNTFDNEPELQALIKKVTSKDSGWRSESLPLGLKKEILDDENEAKHFDGFASACGYKSDAQWNLIDKCEGDSNFELLINKEVTGLQHASTGLGDITGVSCADGSTYNASCVVLAAGAMTSPRILQDYLEKTGLDKTLQSAPLVGANFKFHINSALLGFSPFTKHDVLRKTALFLNDEFPHSSVQCLGWIDGEILGTQLPAAVPKFVAAAAGARAYGFFVTTEDGSSRDNRIISCGGHGGSPVMDYDVSRIQPSIDEHHKVVRAFQLRLLHAGLVGVAKYMGLAGTAHALGSLVTGADPDKSVVDAQGKVHGMNNLYVADGSILPRSSRVNPALTIYAWGLRLGQHLAAN